MKSANHRYFICKILFIFIIISLTFLVISLLTETCKSSEIPEIDGDILYVGGSGPGNYTIIQDAINDSANGDAVYVYNGTYYGNIIIYKSIYLIGEDKENTIINGDGYDTVVTIYADQVNVNGFNIKEGAVGINLDSASNNTISNNNITNNDFSGIELQSSSNNTISNNNITNYYYGICLWYTSNNNTISNNNINDNEYGIDLDFTNNNTVTKNNITNNTCGINLCDCSNNNISNNTFINDGLYIANNEHNTISNNTVNDLPLVYLEGETDQTINYNAGQIILVNCNNITIQNQEITNTIAAIQLLNTNNSLITNNNISNHYYSLGIYLYSSNNNTITENNISNNNYGIPLSCSSNNTVTENNINNNYYGICLWYTSNNNTISNNNINDNEYGIYITYLSDNNILYHNNFINDIENAEDYGDNYWNSSFGEGNYWDDYTGIDENYDNIGDSPYDIAGGNNQDLYPLMNPWGSTIVDNGPRGRSSSSPPNQNQHPKADASKGEPYTGFVGENITFDGTNSSDTDGEIVSYLWDFGDGNNGA